MQFLEGSWNNEFFGYRAKFGLHVNFQLLNLPKIDFITYIYILYYQ